ncbi:NaeI family type II restriction endonuclease [Actinoplanes sp. TFC3]|uniref:NaeI family type II restriction endonuclease n=1 Tax=Actinoplanes sp. TFC3 TaxID=1710355 RepID=UPI00082C02A2|nr:NaeI family type II restriction endonuclease [Actinoplanes sp. TFC3]
MSDVVPSLFAISEPDPEVEAVAAALLVLDPHGASTAGVLRDTFDQIYDGQRTGRYSIDRLAKTERTHIGTLVEINMQRRFKYADGVDLDFSIAGYDVDAKYSMRFGGWMIPVEAQGKLCMLIHADDETARWSLGVIRTKLEYLNAPNRDLKRTITRNHLENAKWLFRDAPLPENTLLCLSPEDQAAIAAVSPGKWRVAELMRRAEGRRVNRSSIEATAQQKDSMKRVRANGGAADILAKEGFLLLSGIRLAAQRAAQDLELPHPLPGTFVPVRVTPAEANSDSPVTVIGGIDVRRWQPGDSITDTTSLTKILNGPPTSVE